MELNILNGLPNESLQNLTKFRCLVDQIIGVFVVIEFTNVVKYFA